MMLFQLAIITVATLMGPAFATPLTRQSFTTLTPQQVSSYLPYTWYAAAAKCTVGAVRTWTCGVNCQANPNFKLFAAGGDGNAVQYWYVGYDPDRNTVIVAHEPTDLTQILSILTDSDFALESLDSSLFTGIPNSVLVHSGFLHEHSLTASQVLDAVRQAISAHGTSTVTTVGFSLGAALALLDGVFLRLQLPTTISIKYVGYGLPRVGNQAWADLVDAQLPGNVAHVNNKKDPVPILPGKFLGYHHPSGEIHIEESGDWVMCHGQDNPSTQCIVGAVSTIFSGDEHDHVGPYNGITMRC